MTRDQLEAIVWQQMTPDHVYDPVVAVDAILDAADTYATTQAAAALGAIDQYRRAIVPPVTHFLVGGRLACSDRNLNAVNTTVPADVKCGRCRNTRAWKDAS